MEGRWNGEARTWGALEGSRGATAAARVWWRGCAGPPLLGPMDGAQGFTPRPEGGVSDAQALESRARA